MLVRIAAAAIIVAVAAAPAPASSQPLPTPSACAQPYLPVFAYRQPPSDPTPPTERRPVEIALLDAEPPPLPHPVTASEGFFALTVHRPDGDVVLRHVAHLVFTGLSTRPDDGIGDLDGDGRDELPVGTADPQTYVTTVYVVPGTVAAGEHEVPEVGVALPEGAELLFPVGDQDGDGVGDLVVRTEDFEFRVVSGRRLLAAGVGGAVTDAAYIEGLDGSAVGVLELGGDAPTLVFGRAAGPSIDPPAVDLVVHGEPIVLLRTARAPLSGVDAGGVNTAITGFVDADGHRHVSFGGSTRGGGIVYEWDLDDPCAGPTPAGVQHTVERGQWLWGIARWVLLSQGQPAGKHDVARYVDAIVWVNHVALEPNPNELRPGTVLVLPILW